MQSPTSSPSEFPPVPERFVVLEDLGQRGAARLVRARDTLLDREVFLKFVSPGPAGQGADPVRLERVLREARALARIDHPAVHGLIDVIETPCGLFLVLEPTAGETLTVRLAREGRLAPSEVVALGLVLADALEVVHEAGIVHRGIHSSSILLGEASRATLSGFDFAKPAQAGAPGSPSSLAFTHGPESPGCSHPAPEQVTRRQDDPRSDLFAVGWVLYASLTGQPPFTGTNPLEWCEPPDARTLVPDTPLALSRALAMCLAHSPSERMPDAKALRRALEAVRDVGAPAAATATAPRSARFSKRHAWAALALVAAAVQAYLIFGTPSSASAARDDRGVVLTASQRPLVPGSAQAGSLTSSYTLSRALLIGVGDAYGRTGFNPLPNAERDIAAIEQALVKEKDSPWVIEKLLGEAATRDAIIDSVALLSDRAEPDDRVLIFFAGHGKAHHHAEGSGWLIPAGASPEKERRATWIRFDEFGRFFKEARAKHILVAMDCCYGGRLVEARSTDAQAFSERYLTRKAHVVITSGRGDERVSDGTPGGNSPFASAFLRGLEGHGPLTTTMLFARIQSSILESGVGQTPEFGYPEGSPVGGEIIFFREE